MKKLIVNCVVAILFCSPILADQAVNMLNKSEQYFEKTGESFRMPDSSTQWNAGIAAARSEAACNVKPHILLNSDHVSTRGDKGHCVKILALEDYKGKKVDVVFKFKEEPEKICVLCNTEITVTKSVPLDFGVGKPRYALNSRQVCMISSEIDMRRFAKAALSASG
ncbi:hypothetical protein ACFL6Y_11210 [Elusimicrobiota bacterium]